MPISAIDAITPAFEHTKRQLVEPFRFGQWMRLAFVGLLAGEGATFSGGNFGGSPSTQQSTQHSTQFVGTDWWSQQFPQHAALFVTLIVLFFLILIGLILLFGYIGSVMRFVLFDSVVRKECHIRKGWRERRHQGMRLFLWEICFGLVALATFAIVMGVPLLCAWGLGWFQEPSAHLARFVLFIVAMVLLFLLLALVFGVVGVMTKDFVVPQMALEDIGAMEGWRRLLPQIGTEKGGYAGYIGMKIVMAIAAAIGFGIVTLLAMLIILVPIAIVAAIVILGGAAAGLTWNVFTITPAVIAGCIVFAGLLFVVWLISVPRVVFFPAYSIYFYAERFPPLAALLSPPTAPPGPPEAPPMPPIPEPAG